MKINFTFKSIIILILLFYVNNSINLEFVQASPLNFPLSTITVDLAGEGNDGVDPTLQILFLVSFIAFIPSLLLLMTSFTRIIIVLHFTRAALGTQQMPPNQVLIGIALFLTFFIMGPYYEEINENAIIPYSQGEMSQQVFLETAMEPIRDFMIKQINERDVLLFASLDNGNYTSIDDVPNRVIIPSFILGEITKSFIIGFIIYIPFIVIDMMVASILMAMGMMMLPPAMISLPIKLLFFILVDGWVLIFDNVIRTIR